MGEKKTEAIRVCPLQVKELTGVSVAGLELVVVPTPDGPKVFEGRCPHQGTLLSEGQMVDGALVCRGHGWKFDASTGKRCDAVGVGLTPVATIAKEDGLYVDAQVKAAAAPAATRTLKSLPGPSGWPFIGNALGVDTTKLHLVLEAWADQYGPVFRAALPTPGVVLSDPALIEQVLRARPTLFRRAAKFEPLSKELGVFGVFSAEGDSWRRQRKLATESLGQKHFERFFPTLQQATMRLKRRWQKAEGAPVDVLADVMRLTVDITTGLAFGIDMNTLENDEEIIQRHLEHIFPALGRRVMAPMAYWRFFKTSRDRELDRALVAIRKILGDLITAARKKMESMPEKERVATNFLEAMIIARDDSGEGFADDVIFGNTLTMLLAGEDTTASSIAWAVHELCERPELLAKARAEVARSVNGEGLFNKLSDAFAMPLLDAIAYETLRFRPVAPFLLLENNEPTVVGDIALEEGTPLYLLLRHAGVRSSQFTDPQVFRPERWLEKQYPHTGGGYMPFGAGPRLCPGRSLALLEMRTVLAMFLHSFDFKREGSADEVVEHWAFTAFPKTVRMRLSPRA